MAFRAAGCSDDEENSDDYDDYGHYRPRGTAVFTRAVPTNGTPKTVEEAVQQRDIAALAKLIEVAVSKDASLLDKSTSVGGPPLMIACNYGFVEGVALLLENGANPNVHIELLTPLMACCTFGGSLSDDTRTRCVKLLLASGADVRMRDKRGRTPLMMAASYNCIEVASTLIGHPKVQVGAKDPAGWTALYFAAEGGHKDMFDLLVAAGCSVEERDLNGKTAANYSTVTEEPEVPDVRVRDLFNDPPVPQQYKVVKQSDDESLLTFLRQLPDSAGLGGFPESVPDLLKGAGCGGLVLPSDVSLPQLLLGCDAELTRLGVTLSPHRRKLLQAVHKFHLSPWRPSALTQTSGQELGLNEAGNVVAAVLKHLVIIRCSILYLEKRCSDCPPGELSDRRVLFHTLLEIYSAQTLLRKRLKTLLSKFSKVEDIGKRPGGFAGARDLPPRPFPLKLLALVASLVAASYHFVYR